MKSKKTTEPSLTDHGQGIAIESNSIDAGYEQRVRDCVAEYFGRHRPGGKRRQRQHRRHTTGVSPQSGTGRTDSMDNREATDRPTGSTPVERARAGGSKGDNPQPELSSSNQYIEHTKYTVRSESCPASDKDSQL